MANVTIHDIASGAPAGTDELELQRTAGGASLRATVSAVVAAGAGVGPAGQGFTYRQAWDSVTAYAAYDVVTFNGSSFNAIAASTGVVPGTDPTKWAIFAVRGSDGTSGSPGTPGASYGAGLLSGGSVYRVGTTGLNFTIAAAIYAINGSVYASSETNVTLTAAHASFNRIDVFAVNSIGAAVAIAGTPAASPAEPSLDPLTQLKVGSIIVTAASADASVTQTIMYAEDTEWTSTTSGGTVVKNSTSNPFAGTKCIEATSAANGAYFNLSNGSAFDTSTRNMLFLEIYPKANWPSQKSLLLQYYSGTVARGTPVTLKTGAYNFNTGVQAYQLLGIPLAAFGVAGISVDAFRGTITGGGTSVGFHIDNIIMQGGVANVAPTDAARWKGLYSANVQYVLNDVVKTAAGAVYIARQTLQGVTPGGAGWEQWSAAAVPGGSDTQIQFNNAGAFGGTSAMTWSGSQIDVSGGGNPNGVTASTNQTSAYAQMGVSAPTPVGGMFLYKLGSSYGGSGLLNSSRGVLINSGSGDMVIAQAVNAPMIFTVAGTAVTSEVFRLPSGGGSVWKIGSTTLATLSGAGVLTVNPTATGTAIQAYNTLSGSVQISSTNDSTNGAAFSCFSATNGSSASNLNHTGTNFTTAGLQVANQANLATSGAGGILISPVVAAPIIFSVNGRAAANEALRILGAAGSGSVAGNIGIGAAGGVTNPTASLHIKAGSATAGTAPLKLTSGTVLGTPEAGAIEFDGTNLFYTTNAAARQTVSVGAVMSLTAPSSPGVGTLWWKTDEGTLKVYYNDGDTSQWVDAAGVPAPKAVVAVAYAASITVNLANYAGVALVILDTTLTGNVTTFTITNGQDGQRIIWRVRQDATGSRTLAYGTTNVRFGTDITGTTLTTTASKMDRITFEWNGTDGKADVVDFMKGY